MKRKVSLLTSVALALCMLFGIAACSDEITPTPLDTPTLTLTGNVAEWTAVANATEYEVYVNSVHIVNVAQTRFTLEDNTAGSYEIKVRAISTDERYTPSEFSQTLTYIVSPPDEGSRQLVAPIISLSENKVSWSAVANATGYEVYIGTTLAQTVTATEYLITETAVGSYEIKVRAISTDERYTPSEFSQTVTYIVSPPEEGPRQLVAPIILLSENRVSWSEVADATGYEVYIGTTLAQTVTATEFLITETAVGSYEIKVRAISTDERYTPSEFSQTVTYVIEQPIVAQPLATPIVTAASNGGSVSWSGVANATVYDVYIDNELVGSTEQTSYDLSEMRYGRYSVRVVARSSNTVLYLPSEKSTAVICIVNKVADRLQLISSPTKREYWLDEGIRELDLTGLSAKIVYLNADPESVTLAARDIVTNYDLTRKGRYEIEFEYDGVYGAAFTITVRERTKEDVAEYFTVDNVWQYASSSATADDGTWAYDGETYNVVCDGIDFEPTRAMTGKGETLAVENGRVEKTALGFGETLLRLTDGEHSAYVNVVVAYGITTVGAFYSIARDLDGYYILLNDLNFAGAGRMIGSVPLNITWTDASKTSAAAINLDRSGAGDADIAEGEAFIGTFDGRGRVIEKFTLRYGGYSWAQRYRGVGVAMFEYIGRDGYVGNFVLRAADIAGMDYSSLIAGYNAGTVENITIEDDCVISNMYSHGSIVSSYNYGNARYIVSYITGGTRNGNPVVLSLFRQDGDYTESDGADCYKGDRSDLTDRLGEGWRYLDGYGTVYCTDGYRKLIRFDDTVVIGAEAQLTFCFAVPPTSRYIDWFMSGAHYREFTVTRTVTQGSLVTYCLVIQPEHAQTDGTFFMTSGDRLTVRIRLNGESGFQFTYSMTVGERRLAQISSTGNVNAVSYAGAGINLNNVELTFTYTDGTTSIGTPTGYVAETYDPLVTVQQSVIFFYYDETQTQYFYTVVPVTAVQPQSEFAVDITVTAKQNAGDIVYSATEAVDFDAYYEFGVVMRRTDGTTYTRSIEASELTVGDYAPGQNNLKFTYTDDSIGNITVTVISDIWFIVTTVDEFAAINDKLDGYYKLGNDLDFAGRAVSIGKAPLNAAKDTVDKADGAGVGKAFTGKFDGNGHAIANWRVTAYTGGYNADYLGYALFAYVGVGGEVGNFTLSAMKTVACNFAAFVAGINCGTVYGVTVNDDCTISSNWGYVGAFVGVNEGVVRDCVCRTTTYKQLNENKDKPLAAVCADYNRGTVTGCVVSA